MTVEDRLLALEWIVYAIADKVGVDMEPVHTEIRNIQKRREHQRRVERAIEEDESFRRSKAAFARTESAIARVQQSSIPPFVVPKPAPAHPDRPRA